MNTASLALRLPAGKSVSPARPLWEARLVQFSARNLNRTATLAVDDEELASLTRVARYRLAGVSYDPLGDEARITLAAPGSAGARITFVVRTPDALDFVSEWPGRDAALCIVHGSGRSVLSFDD